LILAALALAALACGDSAATRRIVVAPAETLVVVQRGSGSRVVIVPGMLGSAFAFRQVTERLLAAGQSVTLIEPLGFGESSRPAGSDYSLQAQAVRVAAILDSLRVGPALFIGHNMGVTVILRLAVTHPEMVTGIVSIDAGAVERPTTPGVKNALRLAPIVEFFGANFIIRKKVGSALRSHSARPAWVTDSVVAVYSAPITNDLSGTLRALKKLSQTDPGDSLRPQLARIAVPVVLLIGRSVREGGVTAPEVIRLRATLPDLRVDSVDRSGEYIHEERPDAVVAAALGIGSRGSGRRAENISTECPERLGVAPAPGAPR
jgi:pimeloyl-ACP methyl ester carboxylesterase